MLLNRLPHCHLPRVANGNQLHTNEEQTIHRNLHVKRGCVHVCVCGWKEREGKGDREREEERERILEDLYQPQTQNIDDLYLPQTRNIDLYPPHTSNIDDLYLTLGKRQSNSMLWSRCRAPQPVLVQCCLLPQPPSSRQWCWEQSAGVPSPEGAWWTEHPNLEIHEHWVQKHSLNSLMSAVDSLSLDDQY